MAVLRYWSYTLLNTAMLTFEAYSKTLFGKTPYDPAEMGDAGTDEKFEAAFQKANKSKYTTPRVRIDPTEVIPTQYDVSVGQAKEIMKAWPDDDWQYDEDPIVIAIFKDKHYIMDGHHRLYAALKLHKRPYGIVIKV
jgi:hypothetical protein